MKNKNKKLTETHVHNRRHRSRGHKSVAGHGSSLRQEHVNQLDHGSRNRRRNRPGKPVTKVRLGSRPQEVERVATVLDHLGHLENKTNKQKNYIFRGGIKKG